MRKGRGKFAEVLWLGRLARGEREQRRAESGRKDNDEWATRAKRETKEGEGRQQSDHRGIGATTEGKSGQHLETLRAPPLTGGGSGGGKGEGACETRGRRKKEEA